MTTTTQHIPSAGPAREALRKKGQFWTPSWIAEAMVSYVCGNGGEELFDPAVGAGAFFQAARTLGYKNLRLFGTEIDVEVLREAAANGLRASDLTTVLIQDFVLTPPNRNFKAIVANPPYIRHHRLSAETKQRLQALALETIGRQLDGRTGYHVFFLLRALQRLQDGGRLSFILPADVCEGIFAKTLWQWIAKHFCIRAIITFTPQASPFPRVDTNPLICLIEKRPPQSEFWWVKCAVSQTDDLRIWIEGGFATTETSSLSIANRSLDEGLATGLSREPAIDRGAELTLGDFAVVSRGIATGANDFFFLTSSDARAAEIPPDFLINAVGRTRDVDGEVIDDNTLDRLAQRGRPTKLFCPDGRSLSGFPDTVRAYLLLGEAMGLPGRPLISMRSPWYKMETRVPPPFLFAYLGRRNARFIRNDAGIVPLTGFLCVYPKRRDKPFCDALWKVLSHPETVANLVRVGKSYGDGAIKVEPRALEKLPFPPSVVEEMGLAPFRVKPDELELN